MECFANFYEIALATEACAHDNVSCEAQEGDCKSCDILLCKSFFC